MGRAVQTLFREDYYISSYELALQGLTDTQIAESLGVNWKRFRIWLRQKPALKKGIARARATAAPQSRKCEARGVGERYIDYVYRRLPPDLQKLWEQLEDLTGGPDGLEKAPKDAEARIERLFSREGGMRARQRLWIHALVASTFNANEACRKVGVSYSTVKKWTKDPVFNELVANIRTFEENFLRGAIFRRVDAGDGPVIMFAARHLLGWNAKQVVEHTGGIFQATVDVTDELIKRLPLEARKALIKQLDSGGTPANGDGVVIDAEDVEVPDGR
jgi:hypothetical protein